MNPLELLSRASGLSCTRVAQAHHIWKGVVNRIEGPVELGWSDGSFVSMDVRGDWTVRVDEGPWRNYYWNASPAELEVLSREVGLWTLDDLSGEESFSRVIGQTLVGVIPLYSEMEDFVGVVFQFESVALRASMWAGELRLSVE